MQNEKSNATPVQSVAVLSVSTKRFKTTTTNVAIDIERRPSTDSVECAIADFFVSCVTDITSQQ